MTPNTDAIRWIFFDMGYTLVNEDGGHHARNLRTVSALCGAGQPVAVHTFEEQVLERGRDPYGGGFWRAAKGMGAVKFTRYDRSHETPFPASAEALARLHTRFKLGIIASQPGGSVERLRRYGLLDYLDLVYSSDEIGLNKPDPTFFAAACRAAGCAPHEAIMVGDRLDNDVAPAKSIGMMTVRLRQGMHRRAESDDPALAPDFDLPGIGDLPAALGC